MTMNAPHFACCDGKGFHIRFLSGWTISVQFGVYNYCARANDLGDILRADIRTKTLRGESITEDDLHPVSATAEIAIWDPQHTWHNFDGDTVRGHCTPDEVLHYMNCCAIGVITPYVEKE